jgi:hypothetical protein
MDRGVTRIPEIGETISHYPPILLTVDLRSDRFCRTSRLNNPAIATDRRRSHVCKTESKTRENELAETRVSKARSG